MALSFEDCNIKGRQIHVCFPLQVGWDESTASERRTRVSIWEIEPVATPFYICPPPFFRPKLPKPPGMPGKDTAILWYLPYRR